MKRSKNNISWFIGPRFGVLMLGIWMMSAFAPLAEALETPQPGPLTNRTEALRDAALLLGDISDAKDMHDAFRSADELGSRKVWNLKKGLSGVAKELALDKAKAFAGAHSTASHLMDAGGTVGQYGAELAACIGSGGLTCTNLAASALSDTLGLIDSVLELKKIKDEQEEARKRMKDRYGCIPGEPNCKPDLDRKKDRRDGDKKDGKKDDKGDTNKDGKKKEPDQTKKEDDLANCIGFEGACFEPDVSEPEGVTCKTQYGVRTCIDKYGCYHGPYISYTPKHPNNRCELSSVTLYNHGHPVSNVFMTTIYRDKIRRCVVLSNSRFDDKGRTVYTKSASQHTKEFVYTIQNLNPNSEPERDREPSNQCKYSEEMRKDSGKLEESRAQVNDSAPASGDGVEKDADGNLKIQW